MGVVRKLVLFFGVMAVFATGHAEAQLPADSQSFLIESGTVASAEAPNASGVHQRFGVACPVATEPAFLGDGSTSTCQNGEISILVQPSTKFYKQGDDGQYRASTYEDTIAAGVTLRVGGKFVRTSSGAYELYATYIWNPGTNIQDPPANPAPSTVQDVNFSRRFMVDATVKQKGMTLTWAGPWGDAYGFVVGNIPNPDGYYGNEHLQRIAAAHRDPVSLDPQLKITTNPTTKFYVQKCEPQCQYHSVSKDEALQPDPATGAPAQVRAAGSYGWGAEGDWRLVATYVWRPSPTDVSGRIMFGEQSNQSSATPAGSSTDVRYDGVVSTGTQLNPGTIELETTWSFDDQTGLWVVSGTWKASRSDGFGTASGTFSGTWKASTGAWSASAIMDSGTGRFAGYTGGGTFVGTNPGTDGPTQTLSGDFSLAVAAPAP